MGESSELRTIPFAWILGVRLDINLFTSNRISWILRFKKLSFYGGVGDRRIKGLCPIFRGTKVLALTSGVGHFLYFFLYREAKVGVEKASVPTLRLPTRLVLPVLLSRRDRLGDTASRSAQTPALGVRPSSVDRSICVNGK